jgi:hypothetical protein
VAGAVRSDIAAEARAAHWRCVVPAGLSASMLVEAGAARSTCAAGADRLGGVSGGHGRMGRACGCRSRRGSRVCSALAETPTRHSAGAVRGPASADRGAVAGTARRSRVGACSGMQPGGASPERPLRPEAVLEALGLSGRRSLAFTGGDGSSQMMCEPYHGRLIAATPGRDYESRTTYTGGLCCGRTSHENARLECILRRRAVTAAVDRSCRLGGAHRRVSSRPVSTGLMESGEPVSPEAAVAGAQDPFPARQRTRAPEGRAGARRWRWSSTPIGLRGSAHGEWPNRGQGVDRISTPARRCRRRGELLLTSRSVCAGCGRWRNGTELRRERARLARGRASCRWSRSVEAALLRSLLRLAGQPCASPDE